MLIAIGPPVGPIIAVNGLNGMHIPYMVWLIKIEIYPFSPQNLKICIMAYGNFEEP